MLIPLTLSISDEQSTPKQVEFYVRKPTALTPRRQDFVKFCDVLKRKIVVREIWKSEEQNPEGYSLMAVGILALIIFVELTVFYSSSQKSHVEETGKDATDGFLSTHVMNHYR